MKETEGKKLLPFLVCNLQYVLCIFLVGIYGRSHFQAERSTSGTSVGKSTFRLAAVGGEHWGAQAPTLALLECLVAHRRSAKLDQPLSLACLSLPRAHLHLRMAMLHWAAWGSSSCSTWPPYDQPCQGFVSHKTVCSAAPLHFSILCGYPLCSVIFLKTQAQGRAVSRITAWRMLELTGAGKVSVPTGKLAK